MNNKQTANLNEELKKHIESEDKFIIINDNKYLY